MSASQASSPLTPDQPWPGAEAYTEADYHYFHGRKKEADELRRLLQREVVTLLSGTTGSGKTSLIRAGLIPSLNQDWLPVLISLDWAAASDQRPLSAQVLDAIRAAATARGLDTPPSRSASTTLWEAFHQAGARWWSSRQRIITPLLIFDRFEDALTTGIANATARRHRDRLLDELSQLASNRPPQRLAAQLELGEVESQVFDFGPAPLRILIAIREELAPKLASQRLLFPTLRRAELRLTDFTRDQARDVLVRGAAQQGLFADGVIDQLLPSLATGADLDHPIPPGELSTSGHRLATDRLRRGVNQITADFFAPAAPLATTQTSAASVPPTAPESTRATSEPAEVRTRSSRAPAWLGVAALLLVAGAGAYLWRSQQDESRLDTATPLAERESSAATPELTAAPNTERADDIPIVPPASLIPSTVAVTPRVVVPPTSPLPAIAPESLPFGDTASTPVPPPPTIASGTPPQPTALATPMSASALPAPVPPPASAPSVPSATASTLPPMPTPLRIPVQATPRPPDDKDTAHARRILERERKRDAERQKEAAELRRREQLNQFEVERPRKAAPAGPAPETSNPPPPRKKPFVPVGS